MNSTQFLERKRFSFIDYALIGMLLGYAELEQGKTHSTAILKIVHYPSETLLIEHKYSLLKNYADSSIVKKIQLHSGKARALKPIIVDTLFFTTRAESKFYSVYTAFYVNNVKVLPQNIPRLLASPVVLAYWFMDCGSAVWKKKLKAVRIETSNFTAEETLFLADTLNTLFPSWKVTVQKNRDSLRLYFPNKDFEFSSYISPHIIDSMKYKVPMLVDMEKDVS